MRFEKPRLITLNDNPITDHNRQPLEISSEMIENRKRMANGTLRKYSVAEKKKFSTSWDMLPGDSDHTVDRYWGAKQMQALYIANQGALTLKLYFGDSPMEQYTVMFSSFSMALQKRGAYDFYSASLELEEV